MRTEELEKLSDEDLVRGLESGCDAAEFEERFRILVSRLQPKLVNAARRFTRTYDEAVEAASRVWEKFLAGFKRYDPDRCSVWTWLYAITRYDCFNANRKRAHECECAARFAARDERTDRRTALHAALGRYLERMPAHLRQPLVLHRLEGRSFEEVGAVLGISARQAEYRQAAALAWLRRFAPALREEIRFQTG